MRAKKVNENLGFQREKGSKESLGIGGWIPSERLKQFDNKEDADEFVEDS